MYNSYASLNDNIKPINQYDLKPKRTTYDGMSMWLYVDQKDDENPRNSVRHPLYNELSSEEKLPQLPKRSNSVADRSRLNLDSGKVNEFLMNNWYNQRQEVNRVTSSYQSYDNERRGRHGPYEYISQAMRNDGNKFLFVQGPRVMANFNVDPKRPPKNFDDISEYQNQYYNSNRKNMFNKLSRQRLDIQQKHAVEHGNWSLMR